MPRNNHKVIIASSMFTDVYWSCDKHHKYFLDMMKWMSHMLPGTTLKTDTLTDRYLTLPQRCRDKTRGSALTPPGHRSLPSSKGTPSAEFPQC